MNKLKENHMKELSFLLEHKMFKTALERAEEEIYLTAYKEAKQNQSLTAKLLGVARGTVISKLKQWGAL